jgi:hypothetical protein
MSNETYSKIWLQDSKQNGLVRFVLRAGSFTRKTLYNSFVDMLELSESNHIFPFISITLMWLQLTLIHFSNYLRPIWKQEAVTKYFNYAYQYLHIQPAMAKTNMLVYFIIEFIFMVVILFEVANMLLITKLKIHKNINLLWLIQVQKILVRTLMTFLAIPALDNFIAVFKCSTADQSLGSDVIKDLGTCFGGIHLPATIVAVFGLLMHVMLTSVSNLWYYETNYYQRTLLTRLPSMCNMWIFFYQITFVLTKNFLTEPNIDYLVMLIHLALSAYIAYVHLFRNPYLSKTMKNISRIGSLMGFWTALSVLLAKVFENNVFDGTFYMWLIGIPFILMVALGFDDDRLDILALTINKIQNADLIINQLNYLLELCSKINQDNSSKILLEGFKETHYKNCDFADCPLVAEGKKNDKSTESLINYIDYIFKKALQKFNKNPLLRLHYIFYLKNTVQKNQEALSQLEFLSSEIKLTSEVHFIVHRTKRVIETIKEPNAMASMMSDLGRDDSNEVPFQSLCKKFVKLMETSCSLHIELWSHLLEEVPDLNHIKELGTTITIYHYKINKTWESINRLPSIHKLKYLIYYGKFLNNILNNRIHGNKLIQISKEISTMIFNRKNDISMLSTDQDLSELFLPTIAISGQFENIGQIIKLNTSAAMLFKYNPSELMGKNIKMLIPSIYNRFHNAYLERAVKANSLEFFAKDRVAFGICKNQYLIGFNISVKPFFGEKSIFYAQLRPIKHFKLTGYVLTDFDGTIESISSDIISIFNINMKDIIEINDMNAYFGTLFNHKEDIMERGGGIMTEDYIRDPIDSKILTKKLIFVEPMRFRHQSMQNDYYIFKFTADPIVQLNVASHFKRNEVRDNEFQFVLDHGSKSVVGKRVGFVVESNNALSLSSQPDFNAKNPLNANKTMISSTILGFELKTYRLFEGKIIELDNVTEENEKLEHEADRLQLSEHKRRKEEEDIQNGKTLQFMAEAKDLKKLILKKPIPYFAKVQNILINVLSLILMASIIVIFVLRTDFVQKLPKYQSLYYNYNLLLNELQNVVQGTHRMITLNYYRNSTDSEAEIRQFLLLTANNMEGLVGNLIAFADGTNDAEIHEFLLETKFSFSSKDGGTMQKNFVQMFKFFITNTVILAQNPIDTFEFSEGTIAYTLIQNILVDIFGFVIDPINSLSTKLKSRFTSYIVDIIIQLCQTAILAAICFSAFLYTQKSLDIVNMNLLLFLDISMHNVRKYISRCEMFIVALKTQITEELDAEEEEENNDVEEKGNVIVYRKRRRGKAVIMGKSRSFFYKFVLAFIALEVLFSIALVANVQTAADINSTNVELEIFSKLPGQYHGFMNSQFVYLVSKLNKVTKIENVLSKMMDVGILNQFSLDFDKTISENANKPTPSFTKFVSQVKDTNLCNLIPPQELLYTSYYKPGLGDCQALLLNDHSKAFVLNGLSIGLSNLEKGFRQLAADFEMLSKTGIVNAESDPEGRCSKKSNNPYCIFSISLSKLMITFQNSYLTFFSKHLVGFFIKNADEGMMPPAITLYRVMLALTIVLLVFIWLYVFIDNYTSNYQLLKRSEKLALIIPHENIRNSPFIKQFYDELIALEKTQSVMKSLSKNDVFK